MKVIKIGAVWCSGCLVMRPRWSKIEKDNPWLMTEYYDFDNDRDVIERHKVNSGVLPVFIFMDKSGKELERLQGEIQEKEIIGKITQYKNL